MIKLILFHPITKIVIIALALIFLIHLISALTFDSMLQYKEISYTSSDIQPSLDNYKITFLTDIHGFSEKKLEKMVSSINEHGTDLVLIGGDFSGQKDLSRCFEILSQINSSYGFYGVAGNHDNAQILKAAMENHDMVLLENDGLHVEDGFFLAGLEDLWAGIPNAEKALSGAGDEDFVLMLCHNPDTSMLYDFSNVNLSLCGHVHGGEVTFFGIYAPAMRFVSNYGQKFVSGWCKSAADTDIYISNGIGTHLLRAFARPQVIYLTLHSE